MWRVSFLGEHFACDRYIAFRREHFACGRYIAFQREHFACGRYIAFQREHFACGRYIAFQREHFACGAFPSGGSILHAAVARRGSIHSCEGNTPLLALHPSRPRRCSALWNVLLCWQGDGFYGVGYCRLCRYR